MFWFTAIHSLFGFLCLDWQFPWHTGFELCTHFDYRHRKRRRPNDMNFKLGSFSKFLLGGLSVLGMLIGPVVAFVLFPAGISGTGNESLVILALFVLVAPFVLPAALSALYALSSEATQNVLGALAKGFLAVVALFVIVAAGFQLYFHIT